jgi:TM2 domain-containing membrane protein YozV
MANIVFILLGTGIWIAASFLITPVIAFIGWLFTVGRVIDDMME